MRVHVVLTPTEFATLDLTGQAAVAVDVLRATTVVVAACAAGCRRILPVPDVESAVSRAAQLPPHEGLLAGERGGEPIAGFDLGNSPLEYTRARVGGRTIVLTTSNGTGAMLLAGTAARGLVAALTNVTAVAHRLLAHGRDVTVLCAGELGGFSLEDGVCAGLLVSRMVTVAPTLELSDAAVAARRIGDAYAGRLDRLGEESAWARRLARAGRAADLEACLRLDTDVTVPVFEGSAIVPAGPSLTSLDAGTHNVTGRKRGPESTR